MRAQIKHLQRELGVTTIYVTHDQVEAMTLADRIAMMNEGMLQQVGAPAEIYNRPANIFVAGFIGNPSMNLREGRGHRRPLRRAAASRCRRRARRPAPTRSASGRRTWRSSPRRRATSAREVFTAEHLGDSTLVTVRLGGRPRRGQGGQGPARRASATVVGR